MQCNTGGRGDEYHIFQECQNDGVKEMCQQFLPKKYISMPSSFKLVNMLTESKVGLKSRIVKLPLNVLKLY